MSVRLKCDMDRLNFSRYLVKCWTSYVKAPVACWMLDLLCDMLGSCWMLDISCDVRISLDVGRPTRRQVLVGCWISRVMSAPIGRESHAMSRRFLLDVGCLARRQVLVGCWVPRAKAGSCWMLGALRGGRFLLDVGSHTISGSCWILDILHVVPGSYWTTWDPICSGTFLLNLRQLIVACTQVFSIVYLNLL